jgi:hypothetical protein
VIEVSTTRAARAADSLEWQRYNSLNLAPSTTICWSVHIRLPFPELAAVHRRA